MADAQAAAKALRAQSQELLNQACSWFTGTSGAVDWVRAKALFLQAAALKEPMALLWEAQLRYSGTCGFAKEYAPAYALARDQLPTVRDLAKTHHPLACYLLGFSLEEGVGCTPDLEAALGAYQEAADQGMALAQYRLGFMIYDGRGTPIRMSAAFQWFYKAASQQLVKAFTVLGVMYELGEGVAQSDRYAVDCYLRAAKQGDSTAQCNLGLCYDCGRLLPQDREQAIYWYQQAARQNDEVAIANLRELGAGW